MSEEVNEQLIKEQLKSLPRPVQEAVASFDWAREVFEVGRAHTLHVDQIGQIQTEVMLVVIGLISPKDFHDQMISRIGINEDQALEIADEVNERVFVPIREFMKNYYAEEEKKGTEIVPSERNVLRNAGISLGDEPEEPAPQIEKAKETKFSSEDDEEEFITPEKDMVAMASPLKPVTPIVAPVIPDIAAKLQSSEVFKTKSSNYLDPYREPVE